MSRLCPLTTRSCGHLSRLCHAISLHINQQYCCKELYRPSIIPLRRCTTIMPKAGYYAVKIGKRPGIYTTWLHCSFSFWLRGLLLLTIVIREDCQEQVDGYPCARYKKLRTLDEAEAWVQRSVPYPVKEKVKPANHFPDEARTSIESEHIGRVPAPTPSSTAKPTASRQSHLVSGSESQLSPGMPSVRSHAVAGQPRMSATAEDVVYTDGACSGNGQLGSVAGIGVWWGIDDPRYVLSSNNDAPHLHLCMPVW
jgi:ribonuclease HI